MGALLEPFFYIIGFVVDIYFKVVVVEIVLHWLIYFKILEANNKYAQKTMEILEKATQPVYKKIGEKIPPVSGFDFSPFILLLILLFIGRFGLSLVRIGYVIKTFGRLPVRFPGREKAPAALRF